MKWKGLHQVQRSPLIRELNSASKRKTFELSELFSALEKPEVMNYLFDTPCRGKLGLHGII